MNSRTIKLLEYNRILEMLAEQAGSELTKERISKLEPMTHLHAIQDAQTETTEAVSVILYKGTGAYQAHQCGVPANRCDDYPQQRYCPSCRSDCPH